REEVAILALNGLLWLWLRLESCQRLAGRHVRLEAVNVWRRLPPLMLSPMRRLRKGKAGPVTSADDEEALPILWDAEVRRVEHLMVDGVSQLKDAGPEQVEEWRRLVPICEA